MKLREMGQLCVLEGFRLFLIVGRRDVGFVWGELEEEMCFEPVDLSDFTHGDFPSYPRNWMGYEGFAFSIPIKYGFVKLGPSFGAEDEIAKIRMVGRGKIGFMMDEFSNDSPFRGPIRPYLESIDLLIGGREVKEYLRRKRGRHSVSDIRRITELFGAEL
jgi:hypothetical protein